MSEKPVAPVAKKALEIHESFFIFSYVAQRVSPTQSLPQSNRTTASDCTISSVAYYSQLWPITRIVLDKRNEIGRVGERNLKLTIDLH